MTKARTFPTQNDLSPKALTSRFAQLAKTSQAGIAVAAEFSDANTAALFTKV